MESVDLNAFREVEAIQAFGRKIFFFLSLATRNFDSQKSDGFIYWDPYHIFTE